MLTTKTIINPLLELGLNKYEAKVYLTLVGEGTSTAKNISNISGIPYGKVYEVIDSLAIKGFAVILPSKPMKCKATPPKEAVMTVKEDIHKKYDRIEKHIINELGPMFTKSRKFIEPNGFFWIIKGRSNIIKKIDELIRKAKNHIYIHCSANSLSRLILHKEALEEAKKQGVDILIASVLTKEVVKESQSLDFCDIKKVKDSVNHLFSVDGKECLIIDPIPDDESIIYGRDFGIITSSPSFTKFLDNFFIFKFRKARSIFLNKKEIKK